MYVNYCSVLIQVNTVVPLQVNGVVLAYHVYFLESRQDSNLHENIKKDMVLSQRLHYPHRVYQFHHLIPFVASVGFEPTKL